MSEEASPYKSVSSFFAEHDIPRDRKTADSWRLTDYLLGEIQGVPGSRGRVAVTDGVMCYIVRENQSLFYGHFEWFEEDDDERSEQSKPTKKRKSMLDIYG